MDSSCRILMLGGFQVVVGDRTITRFRTHKTAALLAYLSYHLSRKHSRETLIDLFWAESDTTAGRASLTTALTSLRRQLEPPGIAAGALLIADRFTVQLNPTTISTDAAEFNDALAKALQAGSVTERLQHLERAVELYEGPLLPGFYEEWVLSEQRRLADLYAGALSRLTGLLEQTGDLPRAIAYARRAIAVDPLQEAAHTRLMQLYAAAGQVDDALQQYRELERLLQEEVGQSPSASTKALAEKIRTMEPVAPVGPQETIPRPEPAEAETRPLPPLPLPTHTVTLLLTDIEGSTRLWEKTGEAFRSALSTHHHLLRWSFREHGGHEIKEQGDSFIVAFSSARHAIACAIACQKALSEADWPEEVGPLAVRMALHTGDVELQEGQYSGLALHHASRIVTAVHGGQILCSEATNALLHTALPEGVGLTDLGVYRLRDISSPLRLHQVEYQEMPRRQFPPPRAESGYPSHLPLQVTRFFGREREIAALTGMLGPAPQPTALRNRLLTLTGPGGSGKTRLALEAAGRLLDDFEGRAWFAPLADLSDPALIASTVLAAMKIPGSSQTEPFEHLVRVLSRGRTLLVLDNFEQLVEGGAEIVQALLQQAPHLTCLLTSRQLLGLPGEQEFPVSPLPIPNGQHTLEGLSQFDSVRLFIDRSQVARPDFQVTSGNAPYVAELCDRLEGIPLAIELAAARIQVMSVQQMLSQLDRRLDLLSTRKRGVAERHRTLRAAIDWSYRLLSPELQHFFARLSVFRGGWTVETASAVCEEPRALEFLEQLRECSLVSIEERSGAVRFSMLETLREYGLERISAAGELTATRLRHLKEMRRIMADADRRVGREPGSTAVFAIEMGNVRAALEWGLKEEQGDLSLELATRIAEGWDYLGATDEATHWLWSAIEVSSGRPVTAAVRAQSLCWIGHPRVPLLDVTMELLREGEDLARRTGDKAALVRILQHISIRTRDPAEAQALVNESDAIAEEIGDQESLGWSISLRGWNALGAGEFEEAASLFERALAFFRQLGYLWGTAVSLKGLGDSLLAQGEAHRACQVLREAAGLDRELGAWRHLIESLRSLGEAWRSAGDAAGALATRKEALGIAREIQCWEIECAADLSTSLLEMGALPAARELWLQAADTPGKARCFISLFGRFAASVLAAGNQDLCRTICREMLEISRQIADGASLGAALNSLGELERLQGNYERAGEYYQEAIGASRRAGEQDWLMMVLHNQGYVELFRGNPNRAAALFRESLDLARERSEDRDMALAVAGLAATAAAGDDYRRATRLFGSAAKRLKGHRAMDRVDRAEFDKYLGRARASLPPDEFAREWETGDAMSLAETIDYALTPHTPAAPPLSS